MAIFSGNFFRGNLSLIDVPDDSGRGNAENNRARKIIALLSTGQDLVTDSHRNNSALGPIRNGEIELNVDRRHPPRNTFEFHHVWCTLERSEVLCAISIVCNRLPCW
jgi:hypothetical protein